MIEVEGDLFASDAEWLVIPTNGERKANGDAVMRSGVTKEAAQRWPELLPVLGALLAARGNHVFDLGSHGLGRVTYRVLSFPTKNRWRESSSIEVIHQSAVELRKLSIPRGERVAMPRVGTGRGGIGWKAVKPIIEAELPGGQFVVVR